MPAKSDLRTSNGSRQPVGGLSFSAFRLFPFPGDSDLVILRAAEGAFFA
jgi:hypothetical protein